MILKLIQQLILFIQQILGLGGSISEIPTGTILPSPTNFPSIQPSLTPILSPTLTPQPTPTLSGVPVVTPTLTSVPTQPAATPTQPAATPTQTAAAPAPIDGLNYSGYYFHIANPMANDTITSTFTAVPVTCGSGGFIAPWPGMGDTWDVENNLAQLGIDIDCRSGTAIYSAWTQALPQGSIYPKNTPVMQGDTIVAKITYQGGGKFMTTMSDTTQNWSIATPMTYAANYVPVGAEVINEEVGGFGVMQFSPISFTNTLNIGGQDVQMATQPSLTRLNMTHAATSDLTGSVFTSTYK